MVVPGSRSAELSLSQTKVKIAALQECKLVPTVVTLLYLKEKKPQNQTNHKNTPQTFQDLLCKTCFSLLQVSDW